MQNNQAKKNKKKRELVYKPYKKGIARSKMSAKKGLKLSAYYLLFMFLYLLLGASLQFEQLWLRLAANGMLVLACTALLFMNGATAGEGETALAEITLEREKSGKNVHPDDILRCYNPAKGWFIFGISVIPMLVFTLPFAFFAKEQVYVLQGLPSWVEGYRSHDEIGAALSYYALNSGMDVMDGLRMIVRLMVFPFVNIATADNASALLLVDRLSPLLVCIPMLGYPIGYLLGPKGRAMVHGDIVTSNKRYQRKQRKAAKERRAAKAQKKNEII